MACHLTLSQRLSSLRDDVIFWLGKFSSDTLLKFFCAIVARGNSVQKILNFPAKSLSIYLNIFSLDTFNDNQVDLYLFIVER